MLYIITGEINSGKSTHLKNIYNKMNQGDGFYNRRILTGATWIGQEIIQLSTGISRPFSCHLDYLPKHWDGQYTYRDYSFSRSGLSFCKDIINAMLPTPYPGYIDEIGPLELDEKGLYQDFQRLLHTKKDIYVVIRNRCLSDVLLKFDIKDYKII